MNVAFGVWPVASALERLAHATPAAYVQAYLKPVIRLGAQPRPVLTGRAPFGFSGMMLPVERNMGAPQQQAFFAALDKLQDNDERFEYLPDWLPGVTALRNTRRARLVTAVNAAVAELTPFIVDAAFRQERQDDGTRAPYHPEVLASLDAWASRSITRASTALVSERWWAPSDKTWNDFPAVMSKLTAARAREVIEAGVASFSALVNDPGFLMDDGQRIADEPAVIIQHRSTGLRAAFMLRSDGFGHVLSKSYRIPSIDPETQDEPAWEAVVGAGVGARIYLLASDAYPTVRWIDEAGLSGSPTSAALRKKLHLHDPWRWEDKRCATCLQQSTAWRDLDEPRFAGHLRNAVAPQAAKLQHVGQLREAMTNRLT